MNSPIWLSTFTTVSILRSHFKIILICSGGSRNHWSKCKDRIQAQHRGWSTQEKARHYQGEGSAGLGTQSATAQRSTHDGLRLQAKDIWWPQTRCGFLSIITTIVTWICTYISRPHQGQRESWMIILHLHCLSLGAQSRRVRHDRSKHEAWTPHSCLLANS